MSTFRERWSTSGPDGHDFFQLFIAVLIIAMVAAIVVVAMASLIEGR